MSQISFIITFKATTAAAPAFRTLLEGVARDLPGVQGCLGVDIFGAAEDPAIFTLVEQWDAIESHQAHVRGMTDSGAWDKVAAHLAQPPESQYFRRL